MALTEKSANRFLALIDENRNGEMTGVYAFGLEFVLEQMEEAENLGMAVRYFNDIKQGVADKTLWEFV